MVFQRGNMSVSKVGEASDIIIFDLDNTLIDTDGQITQPALLDVAKKIVEAGFPERDTDKLLISMVVFSYELPLVSPWVSLCESMGITDNKFSEIGEKAFKSYRPTSLTVFPGVWSTLQILKEKYSLWLVTEGEQTFQRWKVETTHLNELFHEVHIVGAGGKKKIIEEAVSRVEKPSHVVVVGDRTSNEINIAIEVGASPVLYAHGRHNVGTRPDAYFIKSITQLPEVLKQINRRT